MEEIYKHVLNTDLHIQCLVLNVYLTLTYTFNVLF